MARPPAGAGGDTQQRRAHSNETGPISSAKAQSRTLTLLGNEPHPVSMSRIGYAIWPNWPFRSPQGAALAASKVVHRMVHADATVRRAPHGSGYILTERGRRIINAAKQA